MIMLVCAIAGVESLAISVFKRNYTVYLSAEQFWIIYFNEEKLIYRL